MALAVEPDSRRLVNTPLHMSGVALLFVAAGMFVSVGVEVIDGGDEVSSLVWSAVITGGAGGALWLGTRTSENVGPSAAFAAVSWTWVIVSLFGAIPFVFAGLFEHVDDAFFESVAGFTATGSTVLSPIEGNSAGILFWRQMTQWYGGIGMVVLAVAVLPFLGVGGLQLLRAEAPGPDSDRLTPRVSATAKRLFVVYAGLTLAAAIALLFVGMSLYDAVAHAFTAVSTGGFSPYDASIAHFASLSVELILIAVMVAGAVNFTLHWRAVHGEPTAYWRMSEFRVFIGLLTLGIGLATLLNVLDGMTLGRALRDSAFSVAAIGTTTGYATADWGQWVPAIQLLLMFMMVTGAMTGSTSGAAKLLRFQILVGYAAREIRRARHPRGVFAIRHDGRAVAEKVVGVVAGFLILYLMIFIVGALTLTALGSDIVTSLGAAATAMGGVGPALGDAGPASNFLVFSRPARVVLDVLMLLGRLEIFPMLLMFVAPRESLTRTFGWRRRRRSSRPLATVSARPGESVP